MLEYFQNKKCFVTGGAGFIGSHLVAKLCDAGCEVTVYDNLSTGKKANLERIAHQDKLKFIYGDVNDEMFKY